MLCPAEPSWPPLAAGLSCVPLIASASLTPAHLSLQTKPVDPAVDGGAQVQQAVNIECVSDFTEAPVLNIQFRWVRGRSRHCRGAGPAARRPAAQELLVRVLPRCMLGVPRPTRRLAVSGMFALLPCLFCCFSATSRVSEQAALLGICKVRFWKSTL